jgi:hypothetical protein
MGKNKAATALGRKGGKSGTGAAKVRGGSGYYKALSAKAAKARAAKRREVSK